MNPYSTKNLSNIALGEIQKALHRLDYGSVKIYVCNGEITQITKRIIKKTKNNNSNFGVLTKRRK